MRYQPSMLISFLGIDRILIMVTMANSHQAVGGYKFQQETEMPQ